MKNTVAVALSGGLDSAVAAALLKEDHQVIGIHFRTGYEFDPGNAPGSRSSSSECSCARTVSQQLDIPLEVIDASEAFEKEVIRYFVDAYHSALTPNPCIVCNERIKFGLLLEKAMALGVSAMATGHYARIGRQAERFSLLKGVDQGKDQSYFLARLSQQQLSRAVFPLGTYTKRQAREMAEAWNLKSHKKRESQELCFVRYESYRSFLAERESLPNEPGLIVNTQGDVLGRHGGLHAYTVGQRRGIGIPGPAPYYVVRLDEERNRLVVGFKSELGATECLVTLIHWIEDTPPAKPVSVRTRIRYGHREADSVLTPLDSTTAMVRFSSIQYAITPGQAAVFYAGERVLGGGWIA